MRVHVRCVPANLGAYSRRSLPRVLAFEQSARVFDAFRALAAELVVLLQDHSTLFYWLGRIHIRYEEPSSFPTEVVAGQDALALLIHGSGAVRRTAVVAVAYFRRQRAGHPMIVPKTAAALPRIVPISNEHTSEGTPVSFCKANAVDASMPPFVVTSERTSSMVSLSVDQSPMSEVARYRSSNLTGDVSPRFDDAGRFWNKEHSWACHLCLPCSAQSLQVAKRPQSRQINKEGLIKTASKPQEHSAALLMPDRSSLRVRRGPL